MAINASNLASTIVFLLLAFITLIGAYRVIATRSIIHAAFWLFPVFAGVAGFYLFLGAQFLAAIQVLIYIGAILVLIIFAVTLTRNAMDSDEAQSNNFGVPVFLASAALLFALVGAARNAQWQNIVWPHVDGVWLVQGVPVTEVSALGLVLLQQYLVPFEVASVLLLAGMIGAIVLARKEKTAADCPCCEDASTEESCCERETAQV